MKKLYLRATKFTIPIFVSISLLIMLFSGALPVLADEASEPVFLATPQSVWQANAAEGADFVGDIGSGTLPSSIDNSTQPYFPVIGNQGNSTSCVAFAAVYYMYTYEVNRLHNTSAKTTDANGNVVNNLQNVYSPAWAFNFLSDSQSHGVSMSDVYDFCKNHGQLTWNDFPYDGNDSDRFGILPTNADDVVNALSTRISGWTSYYINANKDNPITSANDTQLNQIKSLLASGNILQFESKAEWEKKDNNLNQKTVCRTNDLDMGHSMTIVGYNDTVYCDINKNDIIEPAEYGAFKIANSWGTDSVYDDNGYIWIAYDALNAVSQLMAPNSDKQWDNALPNKRIPAFGLTGMNRFSKITVADYDVNYACLVNETIVDKFSNSATLERMNNNGTNNTVETSINEAYIVSPKHNINQTGYLAFDYAQTSSPISSYLRGYTWRFIDNSNIDWEYFEESGDHVVINSCVLIDNFNNVIKPYTSVAGNLDVWECPVNLTQGDVNYDGVISYADVQILYNYANSTSLLSNVQMALGDMNNDGLVDMRDCMLLMNSSSMTSSAIGSRSIQLMRSEIMRQCALM